MRPVCGWSRYPWDNNPLWKYAWIADRQYVDTVNHIWYPSKGPYLGIPVTGCTFPSWTSNNWGPKKAGSFTFNGTTDMLQMNGLSAIATGLSNYTLLLAFQVLQTPAAFLAPASFSNNSDTANFDSWQSSNLPGPPADPWRSVVTASDTTFTQGYIPASGVDNNIHIWSMARQRVDSGLYLAVSGTYDGVNATIGNLGALDYTLHTATYTRFSVGGYFGATKAFFNVRLRAILAADTSLTKTQQLAADSQLSAANYLAREAGLILGPRLTRYGAPMTAHERARRTLRATPRVPFSGRFARNFDPLGAMRLS